MRDAVYRAIREKVAEHLKPSDELLASALELMDRMLPESPIQAPVIDMELARIVTSPPEVVAA